MNTESGQTVVPQVAAFPRVVPAGSTVEVVVVTSGGESALDPNREYTVRFFSKVDRQDDTNRVIATDERGCLRVPAAFLACGEYTLEVRARAAEDPLVSASFYAVRRDLAVLRPYKGDVHVHTTGSDGRNTATDMLAKARELGLDFVAITDHDNHASSCQAVQDAAAQGNGVTVLKGEEVTIRGIGGHILSLNSKAAVGGKRFWKPETEKEYAGIAAQMTGRKLVGPMTAEGYATAVWAATKVREAGGIAVMAHPYWEGSKGKYYPPRCVFEQMLVDDLIDGVELIGGSPSTEGNLLAVAKYTEEASKGRRLAIVGGSDAHSVDELGRKYTILLAEELTEAGVIKAIVDRKSVACDTCMGPSVAAFGPFDVLEYVYFLIREFFPLHDRVCSSFAGSDPARMQKELEELRAAFWHK